MQVQTKQKDTALFMLSRWQLHITFTMEITYSLKEKITSINHSSIQMWWDLKRPQAYHLKTLLPQKVYMYLKQTKHDNRHSQYYLKGTLHICQY